MQGNVRAILVLFLLAAGAMAQTPQLQPDIPVDERVPVVTFSFEFPGGQPPHYAIAVASTGRAAYRAEEVPDQANTPGEPYMVKFIVSGPTAKRIFDLTRALNFFKGDFEYRNGRIAKMGSKTLTYRDGGKQNETTFNYSANSQLQDLTKLFQDMGNTLEFGRRLAYLYRYDKLGLDAELKAMEQEAKEKRLAELQADEAILRQISGDHSVMNISRRRADRLLALIAPVEQSAAPK